MNVTRIALFAAAVTALSPNAFAAEPLGKTIPYYHVGLVVDDVNAAIAEITKALGVTFDAPHHSVYGPWTIDATNSVDGPPFIEIVRGNEGGAWDSSRGHRFDHFGWHSEAADVPANCAEAEKHGLIHLHDVRPYDKPYTSCRMVSPATGVLIEFAPGGAARKRPEGSPPPGPLFDRLGIAVRDVDAAKAELTGALGVQWGTPHDKTHGAWKTKAVTSIQGPPYLELIQGTKDGPWSIAGGSHMSHITYVSNDVPAECKKLEQSGLKAEFDPKGGKLTTCYRKGTASGIVVEVAGK